jgi:hypothetical protein
MENFQRPNNIATIAVFVFAIIVIGIHVVSLVFPSLIIAVLDDTGLSGDPFEMGAFAIPLIPINIAILIFAILYYFNKVSIIQSAIKFIRNFEVSRNIAILVVVGVVAGYIGTTLHDFSIEESIIYGDYDGVKNTIDAWPFEKTPHPSLDVLHVKNFLLKISDLVFGNLSVVPFIVSIALLLLTYFFTVEITKKRFAGIVALLVLMQSYTFLIFDTVATYENSWTLFYLLSLYLIIKKWYLSPISYVASIFSKPLTVPYFPMSLIFTYFADIPKRKKIYTLIVYAAIALIGLGGFFVLDLSAELGLSSTRTFNHNEFWTGFTSWAYQLRFDNIILIFILPLTVTLFLKARSGFWQPAAALGLLAGVVITMPLLAGVTGYNLHPYRFIPLSVFFAIGVGTLLSNRVKLAEKSFE